MTLTSKSNTGIQWRAYTCHSHSRLMAASYNYSKEKHFQTLANVMPNVSYILLEKILLEVFKLMFIYLWNVNFITGH